MKNCPYVKKKFGKLIHVYDPIFRQNYYVVICKKEKEFRQIIKKQAGMDIPAKDYSDGRFIVMERKGIQIGIIWSSDKKYNLIHECLHATAWCLTHKGMELKFESEETFCYYQAFLLMTILEK
jgi:hypothetical protein